MIRIQEVVFQVYGNHFFLNKIVAYGSIIYETCNQRWIVVSS